MKKYMNINIFCSAHNIQLIIFCKWTDPLSQNINTTLDLKHLSTENRKNETYYDRQKQLTILRCVRGIGVVYFFYLYLV